MERLLQEVTNNSLVAPEVLSKYPIPKHILVSALNKAVIPTAKHLQVCSCSSSDIGTYRSEAVNNAKERYSSYNLSETDTDKTIYEDYLKKAVDVDSFKLLAVHRHNNGIRCAVEQQVIIDFLCGYTCKYDIANPDVWNILDPLLDLCLSVHRYNLYSVNKDFVHEYIGNDDVLRYSINPVEDYKLKYNIARIDATTKLNKMIDGSKVEFIDKDNVFKRKDVGYVVEGDYELV